MTARWSLKSSPCLLPVLLVLQQIMFGLSTLGCQQVLSKAEQAKSTSGPAQIAKSALGSVVVVEMSDHHGERTTLATGFFVGPDRVVTNHHVIEGASSGIVRHIGSSIEIPIDGVLAMDKANDIVLLKASSSDHPSLPIGDSDTVEVGESVFAIGNPLGYEGTVSEGIVSAVRLGSDVKLLQITAPISSGSSGGPVLDSRGHVIGVATAYATDGQNLNFAVPSSTLKALISLSGDIQPLQSPRMAKGLEPSREAGKVVLGQLGQTLKAAPILQRPATTAEVYYRAQQYEYIIVTPAKQPGWFMVPLQNGVYGFIAAEHVAQLPYDAVVGQKELDAMKRTKKP